MGLLIKKFSQKFFVENIQSILDTENGLEPQNFEIFDKIVLNFGKSDDIII